MMSKNEENNVHNNTVERQFELMIDGNVSVITYDMPHENTIGFVSAAY